MPIADINWNGKQYSINFDRKLSDSELYDYMQKNYPVEKEEKTEEIIENPKEKKDIKTFISEKKPVAEKAYNFARAIGQGASFGQGSHLAGLGQAAGGTIYNILHKENPLKDFKKDYKEGREEFKKDYKDFQDKNTALSIGGEILGGLGTGLGSGALKGIMASKPLLKGTLAGAGYGGAYGLSNTEGKALDLKGGLVGAGIGAGAGTALPFLARTVLKPAISKVNTGLDKIGKFYNKGFDVTAKALNPVKEVVDTEGKALTGKVSAYARPAGTQNKTARLFADNEYIQKEALKGDAGLRFEDYGNDAVKDLSKLKSSIKQAQSNAYKEANITDDYIIDLSKSNILDDLVNASKNYNDEIALFAKSTKADTNLGNDLLMDLKIATVANGNKIKFGTLKRITDKLYNDKQKALKDFGKGSAEYKLLDNYYKSFAGLKYQDPKLAEATKKFAKLENAVETFEDVTGIDLTKPNKFAPKIFSTARDRADGGLQEQALEDLTNVLDEFADTKAFKNISDKIKMAQFAYDIRPTSIDSKFSRDVAQGVGKGNSFLGLGTDFLKKAAFGRETSPQEFYQILARRIQQGKIKPSDLTKEFKRIKVAGLDDITSNRLYTQSKLLGNRAGIIGKIIEQFYK